MNHAAADVEEELVKIVASFTHDPLGFVEFAFPWGEGELVGHTGPREWQRQVLTEIGERLRNGETVHQAVLTAVASGHGVGKSALVAWLILWALSTCEDAKVVVTANTEPQLRTKTWPEVGKWHRMLINWHWFKFSATSVHSTDKQHEKTWRADAITWSITNTEAFAGLHNQGRRILLIFDEASAIADMVWEVAEGALTDEATEIMWCVFGNPTRNTGRFRECFGRLGHRWIHRQIDSRTVEGTNKQQLASWVQDYGEDSDFCRIRIKGEFPKAGSMQFIPNDLVDAGVAYHPASTLYDALVYGVDVARFGDDQSVIWKRRGRDASTLPAVKRRGIDTMQLAALIAEHARIDRPDMIFIDEGGVGGGVVDRCRQLGIRVMGINFGAKADGGMGLTELFANKRAEMWGRMRAWLKDGAAIPDDRDLRSDMVGVEYGYNVRNEIQLEKKEDMKKRGLASPDCGDALALTFAHPVAKLDRFRGEDTERMEVEYDPLASMRRR